MSSYLSFCRSWSRAQYCVKNFPEETKRIFDFAKGLKNKVLRVGISDPIEFPFIFPLSLDFNFMMLCGVWREEYAGNDEKVGASTKPIRRD